MFLKKYFLHLEKKNRLGSYEENNSYHSLIPCCHSDCFRPESRVGTQCVAFASAAKTPVKSTATTTKKSASVATKQIASANKDFVSILPRIRVWHSV